jgi:murein DD-endopeptidase MepM/ murein hydrolase activator NlpD
MWTFLVVSVLSSTHAFAFSDHDIKLNPSAIGQGGAGLLSVQNTGGTRPEVTWRGKEITMLLNSSNGMWTGFIGTDLTTGPGRYTLQIRCTDEVLTRSITVLPKDYGIRRFTVSEEMEALDPTTLSRVREEAGRMRELFLVSHDQPLWRGRWIRPVNGGIVSPFGCRTVINELERSPHSGVDLKAAEGTPIRAANKGRVALVGDHFFGGLSVVIDHGGGIHSMYFHLSRVSVKVGQVVERGETIGFSGSSGRATGPHLHFGIRLNGERVNPLDIIELSERL